MNEQKQPADAGRLKARARPRAWLSPETWQVWMLDAITNPEAWAVPLYDQAALDAAVAEERERCAKLCEQRTTYWQRDDIRKYEDECCAAAIRGPNAKVTRA